MRRLVLFGAPVLLGLVNLAHPVLAPPIYDAVLGHLPWWVRLHLLNLALFPLFALAGWLLLRDVKNAAATVSRVALAVFVPLYCGFDAAIGIGTGVLVEQARQLPAAQTATAGHMIDGYWGSGALQGLAVAGSIAWVASMLAAAVALGAPDRRRLTAIAAVVVFGITGWARSQLFQAHGSLTIRPAWWLVTIATALLIAAVARPRAPAALLALAGSLFGATHVPPTGLMGAACFLGAAVLFERGSDRTDV
jgi:hypothetical protein